MTTVSYERMTGGGPDHDYQTILYNPYAPSIQVISPSSYKRGKPVDCREIADRKSNINSRRS